MRSARTRARLGSSLATVALAAAVAGCSGGADATAFVPTPGSDTAYCDAYRAWQVHELDGGEGPDQVHARCCAANENEPAHVALHRTSPFLT